jgi:hypothetical protein
MKPGFSFFVVPALALLFWPVVSHSQTEEKPSPSLEQRVADLEKRVEALEKIPAVAMALKLTGQSANTATTPAPTPQPNAPLEIVAWTASYHDAQYDYQKAHLISYTLKNRTNKGIKLVQGSIIFRDLLGTKIIGIELLPAVYYSPGESKAANGAWNVNTFDPHESRLESLLHEDVKADLIINKVVFLDNSIWSVDSK